jgi:hypothetical protein
MRVSGLVYIRCNLCEPKALIIRPCILVGDDAEFCSGLTQFELLEEMTCVAFATVLDRRLELNDDCVSVLVVHELSGAEHSPGLVSEPAEQQPVLSRCREGVVRTHCQATSRKLVTKSLSASSQE